MRFVYLDWDNKVAEFLPGVYIPLRPFPGVLGVARAEPGRYSTVPPGRYGGNLDIRELTAGTALYVPVFVKGALLWASDAHAAQGNGEVNLTGIETAFREFNITVDVIKGKSLEWPRIETPAHWLTLGYDQDLTKALDILKSETVKFIAEQRKVAPSGGATHHDARLGLPHLGSGGHRQGHVLLQCEGCEGEAARAAAGQGNGDRLRHGQQ